MNLKPRHIQPIVMAGIIAFLMTAVITWLNVGFPPDYLARWRHAFIVAWPLASCAAYLAIPISVKITGFILRLLGSEA